MNKEEKLCKTIEQGIKEAEQSHMFEKPCLKINTKAFVCFLQH